MFHFKSRKSFQELQSKFDILEKKYKNMEKTLSKTIEKDNKKLENTKRLYEENAKNLNWNTMLNNLTVCKKIEFFETFSEKTWSQYDNIKNDKVIILIGNERDCVGFYDRYPDAAVHVLNPEIESWKNMQSFLEEKGLKNICVWVMCQEWDKYVGCMELCGVDLEFIYVYKLVEYKQNEKEQLNFLWDAFERDIAGKKLVLVTINPRAGEFIKYFGSHFKIEGIVSAKKKEIGTKYMGYTVGSAYETEMLYNQDTVFLLCSVNWNDYINLYRGKGYRSVYSLRLLIRGNSDSKYSLIWKKVLAVWGVEPVNRKEKEKELEKLFRILSDEDSKKTVQYVLEQRESRRDDSQFFAEDLALGDPYYFKNREFFKIGSEEIYLDIGPQDGGTIRDFINRTGNRYKSIYAWEIGKESLEKLEKNFHDDRIKIFPYGAWNENTSMGLEGNNGGRHLVMSKDNSLEITCKRIDDVIEEPVSLIKMDIEGAEMNALMGAEETIKKYKPKLIISLYHKQNDIWEIPLFIHKLVPEYKMYIRHQKTTPNDTILFAVI